MKAILSLFVLITLATAFKSHQQMRASHNPEKLLQDVKSSHWGQTIIDLAELHALAGGAVQELITGIEDILKDINQQIEHSDVVYQIRTNQHNAVSLTLTQQIQDAQIAVQRSEDIIDQLLVPRRSQLKGKIQQLKQYQAENRKNLDESKHVRAQEHDDFLSKISEFNEATSAVDDALNLLQSLTNPSLAEIKKFQLHLKKIQTKVRQHSEHATLIKALIQFASSQNFSNQQMLKQIVDTLNNLRVSIVDETNKTVAQEDDTQNLFQARVQQLEAEFNEFGSQIASTTLDLTATQQKIDDTTAVISQTKNDIQNFTAQLELENSQYAQEGDLYLQMKNELLKELGVTEQALKLITSVDYGRLNLNL